MKTRPLVRSRVLLRGEGWPVNRKRTQRLYREEGLAVRRRRSRRRIAVARTPIPKATRTNSRQLANGRRFRVLTVIDDVTKECLAAMPVAAVAPTRNSQAGIPVGPG